MSSYQVIGTEVDRRGVATVTLNRPEKHNALNPQMLDELARVASDFAVDDDVRVVVLAGAGKTWCAGGDLDWMKAQLESDPATRTAEARKLAVALQSINSLPKPVIAKVHGAAYGGGIGLMSVSDIVVAVEGAKFGLTETKLGLVPATIGPFVVRRMGEGFARQVFFSGKSFGVDFALRTGLVSEKCAANDLDAAVEEYVGPALQCAPGAVAVAKSMCLAHGGESLSNFIDETVATLTQRWASAEAQGGIDAFFARRQANWIR